MNIYLTLYDLLTTYIFGGQVVAQSNQELICILVATAGTLFLIALPFILVWRVCKLLSGG